MNKVYIDHETGLIHGLPDGPEPLVGPTSGKEYEDLKVREKQQAAMNAMLERQMLSTYQCTQCKRKQIGKHVRVKWLKQEGVNMETLVCFDGKCDAPVILLHDAGPLMKALGGRAVQEKA
jgi:hypothetical protein